MTTIKVDETSFPLYAVHALNSTHLVTCGGGGAAKCGVNNAIVSVFHSLSEFNCIHFHENGNN